MAARDNGNCMMTGGVVHRQHSTVGGTLEPCATWGGQTGP